MRRLLICLALPLYLLVAADGGELPDVLHIAVGGFDGPSYDLLLTNGVLQYKAGDSASQLQGANPEVVKPTGSQWKSFGTSLDEIGVWNWKTNYVDPNVLDGTQWSVVVKYTGKEVVTHGSNAYPGGKGAEPSPTFRKLMEAIQKLLSGRDFK